jgi:thiol-disulfide isomerase/thioredoxin
MDYKNKYLKYKQKYLELKNIIKTQQGGGSNKPSLYLFKAEWCGHCKAFKNEWQKLQNIKELQNKVNFVTFDSNNHEKEMKEWGIQGFPTIILKKQDNTAIEYNQSRDVDTLREFILNEVN